MRRSPASASGRARASSRDPLVVSARSTPSRASRRDEVGQAGPHRRLAAGEPDRVDAEALDAHPGDPLDLLEGEQLGAGQPLHALGRHAVRAAVVAAVGDRDAQVAVHAPERVGRAASRPRPPRLRAPGQRSPQAARSSTSTSSPAATPSPSGSTGQAVGRAVAASWWLPCAPTGATRTCVAVEGGAHPHEVGLAVGPAGHVGVGDRPDAAGGPRSARPAMRRSAGRASSSKDTNDDTGLPGRPRTGCRRARPSANGLAGRMAICIQSIVGDAAEHQPSRRRPRPCSRRRW